MDTTDKILGWAGLIIGAGLSLAANVKSIYLPGRVADLDVWRTLPERTDLDSGAFVVALAAPVIALFAIEMVSRFNHLSRWLRFGVVGLIATAAALTSFTHIVTVLQWYGQSLPLAVLLTLAVDGLMILSTVALFSKRPDVQPDTDTDKPEPVVQPDTDKVWTWTPTPVDTDTDKPVDTLTVPDMDTLPAAPVDTVDKVPVQRKPRPDAGWKVRAREIMEADPKLSDREVAEKILAELPDTWGNEEAGRKAVSRLR